MKNATRLYTATFGTIMALAGIEHGIGEVLQGNVVPESLMILSWPESEFFHIFGGEPAMTVIPNLLLTGILAILFSLVFLAWSIFFAHKKNGGLVMMTLCIPMLLFGAGLFPPVLGMIVGAVGTRINTPLTWWRNHLSVNMRLFLERLWPWAYTISIIAWFLMLPGLPILEVYFGVDNTAIIVAVLGSAIGSLGLIIIAAFAFDIQRQNRFG